MSVALVLRANRLVLHIQLIQPALVRRPRSFRPFGRDHELDGPPRGHGDSCHMARTRPLFVLFSLAFSSFLLPFIPVSCFRSFFARFFFSSLSFGTHERNLRFVDRRIAVLR